MTQQPRFTADTDTDTVTRRQPAVVVRRYALVPVRRLSLDAVARRSGLHPDLVRRFVALGLVEASRDSRGELGFAASAPATLARVQRLRVGLCLNYA
ncbi:MerR family transcriptional regulator, partial [Streptomyces sp. NPDC051098]